MALPKSKAEVFELPLDAIDVSQPELFENDTIGWYFERLRAEAPEHDQHRAIVSPPLAPRSLAGLEADIRRNVTEILDGLPTSESFDWVDRVSIELTTRMLATLFGFPMDERRKLTWWSEVASMDLKAGGAITTEDQRLTELGECLSTIRALLAERSKLPPKNDLVSMLTHSEMRNMDDQRLLSTLILLIIGGNDTTRNSISGGLLALIENPHEYDKLRADPTLVKSLVPEIIRWQTPLTSMRRTTTKEVTLGGVALPAGAKVMMWYLSGNRDESAIRDAHRFIVDRKTARQHLSFGFGVHRCLGNRLAEMQLRVLWEELLTRGLEFKLVGTPTRTYSNAVRGFTSMPVQKVSR